MPCGNTSIVIDPELATGGCTVMRTPSTEVDRVGNASDRPRSVPRLHAGDLRRWCGDQPGRAADRRRPRKPLEPPALVNPSLKCCEDGNASQTSQRHADIEPRKLVLLAKKEPTVSPLQLPG